MKKLLHYPLMLALGSASLALAGCSDDGVDNPDDENPNEVITTVELVFTPQDGGDTVTATWLDADGDGGDPPVIDDIMLAADTVYDLELTLTNELATPEEDITAEILEEDAEHQFFFGGTEIQSPTEEEESNIAAFTYGDFDGGDLPLGLQMEVTTGSAGTSELQVVLRQMPPVDGEDIKVDGLAESYVESGTTNLPGSSDFDIDFSFEVE